MSTKDIRGIEPGTVLGGKYRVEQLVGEGGMGAVYESTHVELGRKVAIKTLHPQYVSDENVVVRFRREAQTAASIGHDNICEVIDIGTADDGSTYLVMPLLSGYPLSGLLEKETLTIARAVDIICQTLSALQAAHDIHIIHRDLKPDNIFVLKMGDRQDFVKLLDFGISKILDQDSVTKLTQTGAVLGTPSYMSPEQAKGAKDIDNRVDIHAVGVILYEALTGRCPFEGDSYNEIIFKILAEPFPSPLSLNPSIPKAIEHVILKSMSRNVEERYDSANEMREALKAAASANQLTSYTPVTGMGTVESDIMPFTPTESEVESFHASKMGTTPGSWTVGKESGITPGAGPGSTRKKLVGGFIVIAVIVIGVLGYVLTRAKDSMESPIVPLATQPAIAPAPLPKPKPIAGEIDKGPILKLPEIIPVVEPEQKKEDSLEKKEDKVAVEKTKAAEEKKSNEKKSSDKKVRSRKRKQKKQEAKKKDLAQGRYGSTFSLDY